MNLDRQVARLMAVVIVMIAALFAPSVAEAHGGHVHHKVPATLGPGPAEAASAAVQAGAVRTIPTRVTTSEPAPAPASGIALQTPAPFPADTDRCGGVCCTLGAACCHSALTPVMTAVPPPLSRRAVALPRDLPGRPGITLEALPEPPRPFA